MQDVLIAAIRGRSVICLEYNGRSRLCQPHLLAVEKGDLTLEAFQTGGDSERGGLSEWRHFKVDQITNLEVLPQTFRARISTPTRRGGTESSRRFERRRVT